MSGQAVEARSEIAVACGTCVPFGKHRGETIARVGASDAGLAYLKWMVGLPTTRREYREFSRQLSVYLNEPSIARRLQDMGPDFDGRRKT
jgi:hypothetical protein